MIVKAVEEVLRSEGKNVGFEPGMKE